MLWACDRPFTVLYRPTWNDLQRSVKVIDNRHPSLFRLDLLQDTGKAGYTDFQRKIAEMKKKHYDHHPPIISHGAFYDWALLVLWLDIWLYSGALYNNVFSGQMFHWAVTSLCYRTSDVKIIRSRPDDIDAKQEVIAAAQRALSSIKVPAGGLCRHAVSVRPYICTECHNRTAFTAEQ